MSSFFIKIKKAMATAAAWLGSLSFRTGAAVAIVCILCYILSFAQMLLPISLTAKGVLWATFYGLAKASQYTAILILGKSGVAKIKEIFMRRKSSGTEPEADPD